MNRWTRRALGLLGAGILSGTLLVGCGGSHAPARSSPQATATPVAITAANAYSTAFNAMETADAPNIAKENSSVSATSASGINGLVTDHQDFDTAIQSITFPSAGQADVKTVLSADSAYESSLQTLAANVGDVANYNAVFDTVVPLQSAFNSAAAALATELGLTTTTTSPSP